MKCNNFIFYKLVAWKNYCCPYC